MEKRLGLLLHFSSLTSGVVGLGVGAYHGSRDEEEQASVSAQPYVAFFGLMYWHPYDRHPSTGSSREGFRGFGRGLPRA